MTDIFQYNSGSLLMALNPDSTVLNLEGDAYLDSLSDTFISAVSTDNGVYGVPMGTAMGGGVLYNIGIYEELGLEVPTTWDDFIANSKAVKEAGYAGVIQTYADTWTSQLFVLGDFFNVLAEDSDWATEYTVGERKYVDEPALAGFEHLQEVFESGVLNEDFASATYDDGLRMVATGEGAHYPMLTFAIPPMVENYPEAAEGVGFFALPGDGDNGLTAWTPSGLYGSADTEHPEAVKSFFEFVASVKGCDAQTEAAEQPDRIWSRAARSPTTCPAPSRTCCRTSRPRADRSRLWSSCPPSRDRRWSRSRSRSARASAMPPLAPPSMTRTL